MKMASGIAPSNGELDSLLLRFVPGESAAATELRSGLRALCCDLDVRGALLLGPPGTGKSSLARVVALGRYIHLLIPERARQVVKSVSTEAPGRLSKTNLDWYEELPLTGLVESLADVQLFGILRGSATGVGARPGVFWAAMHGHLDSSGGITQGAEATGGVVLLDEIGDLSQSLQSKLLTVVTGAEIFPVGGEGRAGMGYRFEGLTIAATWRDTSDPERVRPDLLFRLSDHIISVPSLSARREDLPQIIQYTLDEIKDAREVRLKRLSRIVGVDKERLARELDSDVLISGKDVKLLQSLEWGQYGEIRGLNQILSRSFARGIPIPEAIRLQTRVLASSSNASLSGAAAFLYESLLSSGGGGRALAGRAGEVESLIRARFTEELRSDDERLRRLADALGLAPQELRHQLADFKRRRVSGKG